MTTTSSASRILVVEDDIDCLDALVDVLTYDGFQVSTAHNGLAALQRLEADPAPELLLVDLMMPIMNGWQLLERLRAEVRWAAIPVVVLSADGRLDKWRKELHVAACLAKPLELEPLLSTVRTVLASGARPA